MDAALEQLVETLLYEGYALYPYTPGATKNATPTPFGIVYPPDYAEGNPSTFDHLRIECVVEAPAEAEIRGTVRFLQVAGERHQGVERRLEMPRTSLARLAEDGVGEEFEFEGEQLVTGRVRMRANALEEAGLTRVAVCVHNTTPLPSEQAGEIERAEALRSSLVSTHVVAEIGGGRFISPLEQDGPAGAAVQGCRNVNTWPVLASPSDDAVLGAAIFLPEHPSMAPESLGNLFDNTEIEEALLLHVHALSDSEREAIAGQDPAVREMIDRASSSTPEEIVKLHGRLQDVDPEPGHPNPGQDEVTVAGRTFRKGGKVVLRPGTERDVYDKMLHGRSATIERIYLDYEDSVHIAVTIDDDPAQALFRETGRYLFFHGDELEVASA